MQCQCEFGVDQHGEPGMQDEQLELTGRLNSNGLVGWTSMGRRGDQVDRQTNRDGKAGRTAANIIWIVGYACLFVNIHKHGVKHMFTGNNKHRSKQMFMK